MKRTALSALVCGTLAAAMVTSAGAVSLYICLLYTSDAADEL